MAKIISLLLVFSLLTSFTQSAFANPDFERLADAIYKSEGGSKTRHPYGILAKYKHTTPRQACINTCKSKYKAWAESDKSLSYLEYLGSKYAPTINASNDPTGLNKNWVKNVKYFLSIQN